MNKPANDAYFSALQVQIVAESIASSTAVVLAAVIQCLHDAGAVQKAAVRAELLKTRPLHSDVPVQRMAEMILRATVATLDLGESSGSQE